MRKLATFGLVGVLAIAGVGLSSAPSDATHRYRSGVSIGLSFGPPQYYYDYPTYYSYRPYRAYSYSYVPRRQVIVTGGNVHAAWCQNRYRSYRAWDNTFQPYYGPRRECISPYWG